VRPCGESVLPELLALFFALYVLFDGFSHEPMRRTAASSGEPLHPLFYCDIKL
jgi:hypothetical protein